MNSSGRVFYLKYRPQKFSELDSTDAREALIRTFKSGKIPHALLLAGPKGIGKTSAARVFAKAINCQQPRQGEPCNQCDICQEITDGTALDLIEIDAASNRGIDDIRNLREKIKLVPAKCRYKVYIIDEAHMLTTEAFNALLKTLEEPPEHAIFILCTTKPEKLPATIVSRCLRFNFQKARPEEIISGSLKRAVKGEKLELQKGVLEMIAHFADGSFRDGHKILEQLSFGGRKITLVETQKLLGQLEETSPLRLLQFLVAGKITAGIEEIDRVVNLGADLSIYTLNILEELRGLLLAKIGVIGVETNQDLLSALTKADIVRLIELFSQAFKEMKDSPIPQLPLELVIVEWGELTAAVPPASAASSLPPKKVLPEPNLDPKFADQERPANLQAMEERWVEFLAQVRPQNHSVEALLRACRPVSLEGEILTLEVFYKFHKDQLETEKCRRIIEEVASQILGRPVKLKCILGEKKKPAADSDIMDIASEIFNGKVLD